jgi:uncharacterized protein
VREHLVDLYEIQKIDLDIREHDKTLEILPAKLHDLEAQTATMRASLSLKNEEIAESNLAIQELEDLIQSDNEKTKKWEKRLADLRNHREYQALSREVEGTKRSVRHSEENLLELMTVHEGLSAEIEGLEDNIAEHEVDSEAEKLRVDQASSEVKILINEITLRRDVLLPSIPKNILKRYEQIRSKRMGIGLVAVTGGQCQGCNMRLPPQLYNILQRADTIEICPSCHRVVVFDQILNIPEQAEDTTASDNTEASATA